MIGIIFVCDVCLQELIIPQEIFEPIDVKKMVDSTPTAQGWLIPELIGYCKEKDRYHEIATSEIKCLCPRHHFLRVIERRIEAVAHANTDDDLWQW